MKVLKRTIKPICYIILALGIGLACYVSIWTMFIKQIVTLANAIDIGLFTWTMVAKTVISCVFAGTIGSLILAITGIIIRILKYFEYQL